MEIDLPEAGPWRLVKSETNLTAKAWGRWLITLGDGIALPDESGAALFSRQFRRSGSYPEHHAFWFFDGEVRPGEPVVKVMDLVTEGPALWLSHNRSTDPGGGWGIDREDNVLDAARFDDPSYCRDSFERQLAVASKLPIVHVKAATTLLDRGPTRPEAARGPRPGQTAICLCTDCLKGAAVSRRARFFGRTW